MAMDASWEERFGQRLEVFSGNDCIVLHLPHDDVEAEDILSLVTSSTLETLLKKRLESTGFFGARFRECAGRSLLIVGNNVHERMPLWMNRLRSQKLLNTVQKYEDFPILLETWRTCLQDEFEQKRQRLSPGYSPQSPRDLIDWIKDRLFIPMHEWEMLQFAMQRDLKADPESIIWQVQDKIARILPPRADGPLIAAWERVPLLMDVFYHGIETVQVKQLKEETENKIPVVPGKTDDPDERTGQFCALFGEWLQYYGPRTPEFIQNTLGLSGLAVETSLENLLDSRTIIKGRLIIDGKEDDICDSENFEILLRRHRMEAVPPFEPLAIDQLPLFLAHYQGLTQPGEDIDGLFQRIEQLLCLPLPVRTWESEIFPSRFRKYNTSWLDRIIQEGHLRWIGYEKQKSAFCFEPDLDLIQEEAGIEKESTAKAGSIPGGNPHRLQETGSGSPTLTRPRI